MTALFHASAPTVGVCGVCGFADRVWLCNSGFYVCESCDTHRWDLVRLLLDWTHHAPTLAWAPEVIAARMTEGPRWPTEFGTEST